MLRAQKHMGSHPMESPAYILTYRMFQTDLLFIHFNLEKPLRDGRKFINANNETRSHPGCIFFLGIPHEEAE